MTDQIKNSLIAALFIFNSSCGSAAQIYTFEGRTYTGTISGSNDQELIVDGGSRVPRKNVKDIDHPGNVAATIGGIIMAAGGIAAGINCQKDARPRRESEQACIGNVVTILAALPIAIYGLAVWGSSKQRAAAPTTEQNSSKPTHHLSKGYSD